MKRKKKLVPLSALLQDDCLGDFAMYADVIFIDVISLNNRKVQNKKFKDVKK